MTYLEFFASVVNSLAWPALIAASAFFLRAPLFKILERMTSVRFAGLEADFREALKTDQPAEDKLEDGAKDLEINFTELEFIESLADISPRAAIIEAWLKVERAGSEYVEAVGGDEEALAGGLMKLKKYKRAAIESYMSRYRELRQLRNEAAHADEFAVPAFYAKDYAEAALRLASQIKGAAPISDPTSS